MKHLFFFAIMSHKLLLKRQVPLMELMYVLYECVHLWKLTEVGLAVQSCCMIKDDGWILYQRRGLRTGWRNADSGSALYLADILRQKADLRNPEMTGHCAPRGYEVTSWCFCPWITGTCRDVHTDIQRANCHSHLNQTFEMGCMKCSNIAFIVCVIFTLTNSMQRQRQSLSVYPSIHPFICLPIHPFTHP